jgi:UDP:flavonoid glycosyltransferase YjiC (YdhE family)
VDLKLPGASFSFGANTPPRIHYATSLPNWDEDLSPALGDATLLILCPSILEVPKFQRHRPNVHFVEPSLRPFVAENSHANYLTKVDPRPLVLASFGTQSIRDPRLPFQLQILCELAKTSPHLRFSVSANPADLPSELAANMTVSPSFAQRSLLREARVFVSHGGLGSLKEAIFAGVPLVVLPSVYDQPFNAMRVRLHNLGSALFPESQTLSNLRTAVESALSHTHEAAIRPMQQHFLEIEAQSPSRPLLRYVLEGSHQNSDTHVNSDWQG